MKNGPTSLPTRREFVAQTCMAFTGLALSWPRLSHMGPLPPRRLFSGIGITGPLHRAGEFKAAGADYLVPGVADFLMPDRSDADFAQVRALAAASPLPTLGCNSFLRDARLRCTGPNADHAAVLAFCAIAFRRLAEVGGKFIGFGSNTARQLPEGWTKAQGDEQFIALLQAMGPLAAQHGITISVEQQRTIECNYLNRLDEVAEIVTAVDHPNIRILADLFHMDVMGDTPADLAKVVPLVGLVEIAEKKNRTVPGVDGQDFRPYFKALALGGYFGPITIEGIGTPKELANAFQTIARQAADVMAAVDGR